MKELTKAEEQIMMVLWEIGRGFVRDIIERLPEPKPAYNTVSTIVRILEKKGFVGYTAFGKSHEYFPIVFKSDYTEEYLNGIVSNYFENSYKKLVSFFAGKEDMSIREIEEIKKLLDDEIRIKKGG